LISPTIFFPPLDATNYFAVSSAEHISLHLSGIIIMRKLQSLLFSFTMALLLALPFVSNAQAQTTQSPNKAVLDAAADHFYAGWANGNWEPFIAMLSDDFIFQFPAGPAAGRHVGPGAKDKLATWARGHGAAGDRVPDVQMTLRVNNGEWIITNDRGRGVISGKPYDQLHAIFMRAKDGKIVEFREYFGNLAGF
jgi:ketosteroid isomerase-like protein